MKQEIPEKLRTPIECTKKNFEEIYKQRVYCNSEKECLYKDNKDYTGKYRCMKLDNFI